MLRYRRSRLRVLLAAAILAQVALTLVLFDGESWGLHISNASKLQPLALIPYVVALLALAALRLRDRVSAWLILGVSVALQVIALTRPPQTSTDDLRYIWDGKVQLAGIDPYRYTPNDPALAALHEPALFTHHHCGLPSGCTLLNHPDVHTVYPPVAQAVFDAVRLVTFGGHGGHGGQLAFQGAAALGVLSITALLLRRAMRLGQPLWWAALWAWSPIVVSEYGNNGHIDWAAILFSLGAIGAYVALRPKWAGALLGAAIATKLYPVLLAPALMRRHGVKVIVAATAVIVLGYIPHVIAVGTKVIGYFPGYLHEEGYNSGSRLILLGRVLPHPYDSVVGVLLMAALGILCLMRTVPEHPEYSALWLVGAAFLIFSPNYGWYPGLLIALVAMTGRWYWLPVALAPTLTYLYGNYDKDPWLNALLYGACALATAVAVVVWRRIEPIDVIKEERWVNPPVLTG